MQNYKQYYQKLDFVSLTRKGKKIYRFKCLICNHVFSNHNNAASHISRCLKNHAKAHNQTKLNAYGIGEDADDNQPPPVEEPPQVINSCKPLGPVDKALIELIAECNIPYTQVNTDPWVTFIHALNPTYNVPSNENLRENIISYSQQCIKEGLDELQKETCGLAIDGATLIHKHCYAFILVSPSGLRLAGIKEVSNQSAATLAVTIAEMINICQNHQIILSGVVSDNAPALVKALVENDPRSSTTMLALIGCEVLRCACAAHTGQLSISDLMQSDILNKFFDDVVKTLQWLKERKKEFSPLCHQKMPSYISTRWNTLYFCAKYLWSNKETIDQFLHEQSTIEQSQYEKELLLFQEKRRKVEPSKPIKPPIDAIPSNWHLFLEPLKIIAQFTDEIERDLALQQDVYTSVLEVYRKLEALDTPVADSLLFFFKKRFSETADLSISKLAFYLTPDGIVQYRSLPDQERRTLFAELKRTFMRLSEKLPIQNTLFFPAIFRYFMDNVEISSGDSPLYVYEELEHSSFLIPGINKGNPVPFSTFAMFCRCLVSLPASEAMVERCFSQIKTLSSDFNKSMKSDLFIALASLKLFVRYRRRYFFACANDDIIEE